MHFADVESFIGVGLLPGWSCVEDTYVHVRSSWHFELSIISVFEWPCTFRSRTKVLISKCQSPEFQHVCIVMLLRLRTRMVCSSCGCSTRLLSSLASTVSYWPPCHLKLTAIATSCNQPVTSPLTYRRLFRVCAYVTSLLRSVGKANEALTRIGMGLAANPSVTESEMLLYVHATVAPFLLPQVLNLAPLPMSDTSILC